MQERQSKKNAVNRASSFLAFWCYCEERGEKKRQDEEGDLLLNLDSNVRLVFHFIFCRKNVETCKYKS